MTVLQWHEQLVVPEYFRVVSSSVKLVKPVKFVEQIQVQFLQINKPEFDKNLQ